MSRAVFLIAVLIAAAPHARTPPPPHAASATPAAAPVSAMPTAEQEFDSGQLHFARGEYRQAADAFGRAAARLDPAEKPRARYWTGLSWLGAGDGVQARSAFEDVVAAAAPELALARLGIARSWEMAGRPERALAALRELIVMSDPGEAGPTMLARFAVLSEAQGDTDAAHRARQRLLRDYPASMEAASERLEMMRQRVTHGAPPAR
jgi:tetratricopeptide (TPR) repeat protein